MKIIILIIMLVLNMRSLTWAGFKEATDAFERGDSKTALKEFGALAEKNDPRGQYGLGIMHDLGEGVPQNSELAFKWYKLSAEQGYADAQNNLGAMYGNGEGVSLNYEESMRWYRSAAELGNKDAPNNIGVIYMTGVGAPRDFVKAYMWFSIAGGDPAAVSNKKFLLRRLSQEEVAQAENMAREWLKIRNQNKAN